jgi:SDR family mycofactocin-dependent oxidoreductase
MRRLEGKVAFITGVARGQGRSHAVRMAEEGADIIGLDICRDLDTVQYAMATEEDLAHTVKLVEQTGRGIIAERADVRERAEVEAVLAKGLQAFGHVDCVLANAGIMPILGEVSKTQQAWHDGIDTMLTGVFNTVDVAIPHMVERGQGGSIVITSSAAGLRGYDMFTTAGGMAYTAAKHGVVGLMRTWANVLGPQSIRVNSIHPTGVNTPMVANEAFGAYAAEFPAVVAAMSNALPVPMVESSDISNAVVFLCSDEGRYVTGVTLPVDAGSTNK